MNIENPQSLVNNNNKFTVEVTDKESESEREKSAMFYSQCLLSKNGALAAIWVAGCCYKRLKKRQVNDTHIPSSVDKILLEGLSSVTYRILAYLLLGVVRIYSRKVEYLFQDCHETVSDINKFSVGKKVVPFRDLVRSSYSIILPETYELDAFQLEVAEGSSRANVARNQDIILQDARKDTFESYSFNKNTFDEVFPEWEENCNASTSAGITMQKEIFSSAQTPDKVAADRETSSTAFTPPDKVLSPHQMEIDMGGSPPNHMKNLQTSKEKLRELRFPQEDCMDIDMICGLDVELINLINEYEEQKSDGEDQDDLEEAAEKNLDHVTLEDKEVPASIERTPNSGVTDAAGLTTQEILAVSTSAKKIIQRPSKRKCIIDETVVLDNQAIKQSINDASGLVCKRRKAPHTVIDVWRLSRIPNLSKNFLQPLIPCAALELQHVHCKMMKERTEPSSAAADPVETTEALGNPEDAVSTRTPADSRSGIAPGTPVRGPASARVFASPRVADSDAEGPDHSYENVRDAFSVQEDHAPSMMDEMGANEGDSQELHRDKNGLSARTRNVARYLHEVVHKKKQQGEEAVTLLPIVKHKTRAENARFFFEILVLTSQGFVNVVQDKAYDDVLLQETPKMDASLASC